jgi:ER-bound oxygenase mpaB/B'/Rubber oxygenase, catalytic domain
MTGGYPERQPEQPTARIPFPALRRLAPGDIRATHEQRASYLRHYPHLGDPPADAVVAMIQRLPPGHGRALFDTALEHGIDAITDPPAELRDFFAVLEEPYWLDAAQLDLACRVTARTGPIGVTALAMLALCGGYLAYRVTKPLVRTGNLEYMAPQRLAETVTWWLDVTTSGGMHRFAPGFKGVVHVRLTHALVRAGMARRPDWDSAAWDLPLNNSQLAGTVMLFGLAPLAGSQVCGLHFTAVEKDAVYHLWRYVGHLIGVRPEILPSTEKDCWRMLGIQGDYEFLAPDEDSRRLAQALIHAIGPLVAGDSRGLGHDIHRAAVTYLMCAYGRLVLGKDNADLLGLPDRRWAQGAVIVGATLIGGIDSVRRLLPGMTRWCEIAGRRSQRAATKRMTSTRQDRGRTCGAATIQAR